MHEGARSGTGMMASAGAAHVLLVEDDDGMRMLVGRALRESDAELAGALDAAGFSPQVYALPWVLTLSAGRAPLAQPVGRSPNTPEH